jgi:hypothetical protein
VDAKVDNLYVNRIGIEDLVGYIYIVRVDFEVSYVYHQCKYMPFNQVLPPNFFWLTGLWEFARADVNKIKSEEVVFIFCKE